MADTLPPRLDPKTIEGPLYRSWTEAGYFHVEPESALSGGPDPYVVVIPPPNVTDILHMGHGLNNTIQDVMVRWRRMQGRASLWVPGTDHAGIATQNVVERRLADEGTYSARNWPGSLRRARLGACERGREVRILEQLKVIGSSCDLGSHPLYARRRAQPGGPRGVRAPLRKGPDLPGGIHHQLVPPLPDRALQRGG